MNYKIRVYFLGSGKIAVPILKDLVASEIFELVGIGTQIDHPAGRKKLLHPTPVGEYTEQVGLKVDKIPSVNSTEFLDYCASLTPDFVLVVSFGQILKQPLLDLPSCGCINIHASLLPLYRGASPIVASIINRDKVTGVTFMRMDKGLDTGKIYRKFELPLNGSERADHLEITLGELAATHLADTLYGIFHGAIDGEGQDDSQATLTKKIKKDDGHINWLESAIDIEAKVRGYYPWPGAIFNLNTNGHETSMHITEAAILEYPEVRPGEILEADRNGLVIACGRGALKLEKVIPQGKKEMSGAAFINGHHLQKGANILS